MIERKPLVKLFSSVPKRDGEGRFWLETAVEKGRIEVEDAAFVAVEMTVSGAGREPQSWFRTNVDLWVNAGDEHPICVVTDPVNQAPPLYVRVRQDLDALIVRAVFHELVERGVRQGDGQDHNIGVWSGGVFFVLGKIV